MCGGSARRFWLIALAVAPAVARSAEPAAAPLFSRVLVSDDLAFDLSTPTWCCDGVPADAPPRPAHELRALPPDPSSTLFVLYALGSLAAVELSAGLKKLALSAARSGHAVDGLRAHQPAGPESCTYAWNAPRTAPAGASAGIHMRRAGMWRAPRVRSAGRIRSPRGPPV